MSNPIQEYQPVVGALRLWGRRIFPRRLFLGLAAVIPAIWIVEPARSGWTRTAAALALILAGLGMSAWAAAYAGAHTRSPSIGARDLVTAGPYSRVRNPIYLGTVILGLGMTGLIGDWRLAPLLFLACLILYVTIIPAEEQFLAEKFGAAYARYRDA